MMLNDRVLSTSSVVSIEKPILTPKQEQEKWLGEAVQGMQEKASVMKVYIRQCNFKQVLRSASQMLSELRTSLLAPQNYYELYVKVFDEMRHLEQYCEEEHQRGRSLDEMYEAVQHTGNIVPRLYLLITVGSVFIKSGEQPAIEILRDLVEMCKGVQHPTRGLFLRHFLLTMMKNKLPGDSNRVISGTVEVDGGTVDDTAELILQNFKEMNWLWIRMEGKRPLSFTDSHYSTQRKHRDRKELCVLVGMNIVRISQLEGVERKLYKSTILPRLLDILIRYREPLAQQYLLDVIVQVFPDEFHLFTLDELLGALRNVSSTVDTCVILESLMERLGNYAASLRDGVTEAGSRKEEKLLHKMFETFKEHLDAMPSFLGEKDTNGGSIGQSNNNNKSQNDSSFTVLSYVKSMFSLVRLSLKLDPVAAPVHIGIVLRSLVERLSSLPHDSVTNVVECMLIHVIETLKDPNVVLCLDGIDTLTQKLPFSSRHAVAIALCRMSVESTSLYRIATLEAGSQLFELIMPFLRDEPDALMRRNEMSSSVDFVGEQHLVCRVLHLLQCDDVVTQMKMLNGVRKQLAQGGLKRIILTFPTVASLYVSLVHRIHKEAAVAAEADAGVAEEEKNAAAALCAKALHFVHSGNGKGILEILASEVPLQAFHLYLLSANAADMCGLTDVAYEHYVCAFQLYEENAVSTQEQIEMVCCVISSLRNLRNMPEENYELLATKVCQYSSKLVRKSDQSHVVSLCASLFWKTRISTENHHRVQECIQRALKIADHVQAVQQLPLFVELLNQVLHYYAGKAPGVTAKYISALVDLVQEATSKQEQQEKQEKQEEEEDEEEGSSGVTFSGGKNEVYDATRRYYRNTARYIRSRQQVDERWKEIEI